MKKTVGAAVCIIFLSSFVLIPFVNADWTMFLSDPSHSGSGTGNPTLAPTQSWKYGTGDEVSSSPAVVGGLVYVGSDDNNIYALNATDGAQLWSYKTGNDVGSSPAVVNGVVYIGSMDDNVYALNAADGTQIWNYSTGGEIYSSPAVVNGVVYIGSEDDNVYALNAANGVLIWSYTTKGAVFSSPAVANGVVYVGSRDNNVYALNAANGAKIWNYTTNGAVFSSPAIVGNVVYIGSDDDNVYALNANNGDKLWSYTTGASVWSSPAVANGIVYVGSNDDNVYALNATSGAQLWSYATEIGDWVDSSPAVVNGVVYVGSQDNNVYALNADSGVQIWSYPTSSRVDSSPTVVNGVVYVGSMDDNVYALVGSPPSSPTLTAPSENDITINADGSVSPSYSPIQQTGNVYTLTSDVQGHITVNRNNTILNGDGHTLSSTNYAPFGLQLNDVSNVTVKNFIITGGENGVNFGISLTDTSNATVANNTIKDIGSLLAMNAIEYVGINVEGGSSNNITGNNLVNNIAGMDFSGTENNLIDGNNIADMSNPWEVYSAGIFFSDSSNNTIYHNNFATNPIAGQAGDSDSFNVWDDGYPGGGNYWSDYQTKYPNATEIGSSGIGDTPYVIDTQNKDRYPLMEPFTGAFYANYLLETTPPKISLQSPVNQTYNESSVSLVFSVDKTVDWMGYSLDGQQNVTITRNSTTTGDPTTNVTIANLRNGLHSIIVYANDTSGNMGASENVTFTIALASLKRSEPFPIVVVAVAIAAFVAVIGVGLIVYSKKHRPKTIPSEPIEAYFESNSKVHVNFAKTT